MNLQKLNPWNWFKHESGGNPGTTVPVRREEYPAQSALSLNQPLAQFHQEVDRLFDGIFRSFGFPSASLGRLPDLWSGAGQVSAFNPELNVASDDEEYVVTVEAAGLNDKDVQIEVADRRLLISGNKQEESENKQRHFYRIERRYGAFQRVLALPDDAQADQIRAAMHNGLLTIRIPRRPLEHSDSRRITIESS